MVEPPLQAEGGDLALKPNRVASLQTLGCVKNGGGHHGRAIFHGKVYVTLTEETSLLLPNGGGFE